MITLTEWRVEPSENTPQACDVKDTRITVNPDTNHRVAVSVTFTSKETGKSIIMRVTDPVDINFLKHVFGG